MEIKENLLTNIDDIICGKEDLYAPIATKNSQYLRRKQMKHEEPIIRPPFYRDGDRIIHSRAYARYIDKTQVFFLVDNDHITHRVLHVQLVSKIARTIGRSLSLNEDLIEAISLGHDIGHVPYGHFGEKILSDLCEKNGIGKFLHNVQSIQFLDVIEDCDLTIQVLDGILCHNGGVHGKSLKPYGDMSWESFQSKIEGIKLKKDICPMTIEGCVVRIADTIAYLGRDLQDALEVNIIQDLDDFPQNCIDLFGISDVKEINWAVLDTLIKDVINNSFGKNTISFSDNVSKCVHDFYEFNEKYIYHNPLLMKESEKIEHMYGTIFNKFLKDLENKNKESFIYSDMINLDWVAPEYFEEASPAEIVRDYIAGMTDRYFEFMFNKITIPDRVKRRYK
ncbi:MAG TPA: HD domain-containing protein [Methanosarcinaceae archaeon]|nr:HD domain-containing protein [Methanosarcinaceae archaeon]